MHRPGSGPWPIKETSMKKQVKKMALNRETLRALDQQRLVVVAGGSEQSVDVCTESCNYTERLPCMFTEGASCRPPCTYHTRYC